MRPIKTVVASICLALFGLWASSSMALADETADRLALDQLFIELRIAPDAESANEIDQKIWQIWTHPSDTTLAERMTEVLAARRMMQVERAMRLLDQLVADYPRYAEGWNQRATLHYLLQDFEASLADIQKVLELEPRHFGALSGRAMIYRAQGKRALALRDMGAALAIHPFLVERALFPELSHDITRI